MRRGKWRGGPVEWTVGSDAYLSVVFTWHLPRTWSRAVWLRSLGYTVHVGGPGVHVRTPLRRALVAVAATVGGDLPDAVARHNPMATFASRGCSESCWFCIVPSMEGDYTEIEDFPVRPVLCDNNLSGLDPKYQDHIVKRYKDTETPLLDANSGFEPRTFDEEVFNRWEPINRGPWRFALDDQGDLPHVLRVLAMLKDRVKSARRKRVYVLIGNEPVASCMERIQIVLDAHAEPYVQPIMKLNAVVRRPWVMKGMGWSRQLLLDVQRWANWRCWRYTDFEGYRRGMKTRKERP